jgi:hypothetical protein
MEKKLFVIHLKNQEGLFLCDRNIKIGDRVITPCPTNTQNDIHEDNLEYFTTLSDIPFDKKSKLGTYLGTFKVIGKISSNATWVKEFQEFDKDELMANGIGHNWTESHTGLNFKVKGPCGHFH